MEREQYLRVGTDYYKMSFCPQPDGTTAKTLIKWSATNIKWDHGSEYLKSVPKYDGFCTIPSHDNYMPVVNGYYNEYCPIDHKPKEGEWPHIESLVRHLFSEQYELAIDYLQLLYLKPMQRLPILLLVSEERNTGKSTFLQFLKMIFGGNATFNTNEQFRSRFNDDWTGKLLVMLDEALLNKREDSERLKNLSTGLTCKEEAKGKDKRERPFFGKFVMCSNNELNPIYIDEDEIRYWVRKVSPLSEDDPNFRYKLKEEIPAFLFYLKNRALSTKEEGRMWFSPKMLRTAAFERMVMANKGYLELEMAEAILDLMDQKDIKEYQFTPADILQLLSNSKVKADRTAIKRIAQDQWKLAKASNSLTYTAYVPYGDYSIKKGRYYTVERTQLEQLLNDK